MSWVLLPLPAELAVGFDVRAARVGSRLHVLAGRPAGDGVSHLVLTPDGDCELRPTLPLATVTGAAAGPDGLVLAGARLPDGEAVIQAWPDPPIRLSWSATAPPAPPPAGPPPEPPFRPSGPVAAWPVPVAGEPARVVWATGPGPVTVWVGQVTQAGITAGPVLRAEAVYGLQATGSRDGVDLLCETPDGSRLVRAGAGSPVESAAPRDALLVTGFLLTAGDAEIVSHSTDTGAVQRIPLPDWPAGQRRGISRLTLAGDLLTWTTERIDEPTDPEPLGWAARFDPTAGSIGPAVALPFPGRPAAAELLDGRILVVQPIDGRLTIWLHRTGTS